MANITTNNILPEPNLVLFCDGGCRLTQMDKPAACGFVLASNGPLLVEKSHILTSPEVLKTEYRLGKFLSDLPVRSNNSAEWLGLYFGLEYILTHFGSELAVQVLMDSNLVIQQIQGKWKVKEPHLQVYFQRVSLLAKQFPRLKFEHIFRQYNSEADKMANLALDLKKDIELLD